MMIALPSAVKVFNWLGTIWGGRIYFTTPMLFALSFVSMFIIGGLSGIFMAATPVDIFIHDTYFIVAHFHYVLFAGTAMAVFGAIYFWYPKVTGRMYNEMLGKIHFWIMTIGFYMITMSMFAMGLMGMRRRVIDYSPAIGVENLHMVATIGGYLVGFSVLIFVVNLWVSARNGMPADNPWNSRSIEWQTASPPSEFNFDELPYVEGEPYDYGIPDAPDYITYSPAPASGD